MLSACATDVLGRLEVRVLAWTGSSFCLKAAGLDSGHGECLVCGPSSHRRPAPRPRPGQGEPSRAGVEVRDDRGRTLRITKSL